MQEVNKTKDVFLTKAQFEARKTAGTLQEGVIYHTTDETVLTPDSLKTIFGNQSLIKDPSKPNENNVDLYKHYLKIGLRNEGGTTDTAVFTILSSSNIDCTSSTGATQKLKDLLKISGTTERYFENGTTTSGSGSLVLRWTGTVLQVAFDSDTFSITSIEDKVETV